MSDAGLHLATGSGLGANLGPLLAGRSSFHIGGVTVAVKADRPADVAMLPPLAWFRSERVAADIDVHVEWVSWLQPEGKLIFDSGATWRLCQRDREFQFDFSAPFFGDEPYKRLLVDEHFKRAILQMNAACRGRSRHPGMALSYPLDELLIMHRLTQEKAIELHGAGIVCADGIGNLFVGHSEAGKSTTTRLWTEREDVEVLSDDRIIVRRDERKADPVHRGDGHEGVGVIRLRDRPASTTDHFAQDDKSGMRMYGTPWHGEAMYASPNSAPLARIFILEHGQGNVLTPLSRSHAVAELFARSFVPFHRHEYVESALSFLEEVADAVPVYRFAFEPDQRAVETILNLHD